MDHLVPIIRGGKSTKGNVAPSCKKCNSERKYRLPFEDPAVRLEFGGLLHDALGFELLSFRQGVAMSMETFLVRTMSDTVETDIQRVFTIANEILPRYEMPPLSFAELRKIADGPFDLFLIPLIFAKEYQKDRICISTKRSGWRSELMPWRLHANTGSM